MFKHIIAGVSMLFAFTVCVSPVAGQTAGGDQHVLPADTLAEIGTNVITARDLIERIELMPWMGKDKPSRLDSAKIRGLQSLVAEHLLAQTAAAQGMGTDSLFRMQTKNIEKLMVRDELYKRDVRAKVAVSRQDILEGMKRYAWAVKVLMIDAVTKPRAEVISHALRNGTRPENLLVVPVEGARPAVDTVTVTFGLLEKSQEDVVYGLDTTAPASAPLNVPRMGWVVLYLLDRETNPEYAKLTINDRMEKVKQKLQRRKELVRAGQVVGAVLKPERAEAKPEAFDIFAKAMYDIARKDSALYRNDSGYRLDLMADAAEAQLRPHLHDVLVDLDGGGLTILDMMEGLKVFNFFVPSLDRKDFFLHINGAIREIVSREYLTREGMRRGLQRTDAVRHDVAVWSNSWLATALERRLVSDVSVSDEEVMRYLVENAWDLGANYQVNVREVLSDSLSKALTILERLTAGENLKTLARTHSIRKDWAARDGESGYFVVARHPEIGFLALESDTGKICGPVKTPEGYSIFTTLGKRQTAGDTVVTFDSLRTLVRLELRDEKTGDRLDDYVASVAKDYKVTLHYDRLKNLSINPTNLVVKRLIGFGGAIPAVPGLLPLYRWVDKAGTVQQIFP